MKNSSGIIVLGMHRSGTSLAAELVHRWGARGEDHAMLEPDEWNPRGYWEYRPLVEFNGALLGALESSWKVPPWEDADRVAALAQETAYRVRAFELLEEMRREGRPWFWKDPRITVLLPFWKQLWGEPAYIVPVRDPGAIAASLKQRDGLSYANSLLLWQRYMSATLLDPDVGPAALFFSYEDLLDDRLRGCRRICDFLDRHFEVEAQDLDKRVEAMAEAVAPELSRSRASIPFLQSNVPTRAQHLLNRVLQLKAQGVQEQVPEGVCLEASWREHLMAESFAKAKGASVNNVQVFWRNRDVGYSERHSRLAALREGSSRQSVRIYVPPTPMKPTSAIRLDLGDRQGLMYIYGISIASGSGEIIWAWDGCPESIEALPRNQAALCEMQPAERGCFVELIGSDPWIEIVLDQSQSDALSVGGSVLVDCCYYSPAAIFARLSRALSTLPQLKAQTANLSSKQDMFSSKLSQLELFAESLIQQQTLLCTTARALEARADTLASECDRISTQLHETAENVKATKEFVQAIVQSRTWRMLTSIGGIILRIRRRLAKEPIT